MTERERVRTRAIAEGASDGVYAWLEQHPVTVQEPIIDAVGEAVTRWLDADGDEIIAAVEALTSRTSRAGGSTARDDRRCLACEVDRRWAELHGQTAPDEECPHDDGSPVGARGCCQPLVRSEGRS